MQQLSNSWLLRRNKNAVGNRGSSLNRLRVGRRQVAAERWSSSGENAILPTHRMTDDSHVRLHENGTRTQLESLQSFFVTRGDPGEAARLEEEHLKTNRKIMDALVEKGFTLFTINMALRTGLVDLK